MEGVHKKLMMLTGIVLLFAVTGCTGIHVEQGISPATILLPGLLGEHDATQDADASLLARHLP